MAPADPPAAGPAEPVLEVWAKTEAEAKAVQDRLRSVEGELAEARRIIERIWYAPPPGRDELALDDAVRAFLARADVKR